MDNMAANQQIERYLLRQMDEQEASEFEAYYLSNNECIDQLEMAERLLEGLRFAKDSQPLSTPIIATKKAANDSRWWRKGLPVWASAAMVMITLFPSLVMYNELKQQSGPSAELSVLSLPLTETRSADQQVIKVPFSEQRMILSMFVDTELEQMVHPSYTFELSAISQVKSQNANPWIFNQLKLDHNDMLYIDLGKSVVNPGSYRFTLLGLSENNEKREVSSGTVTFELQH
ncbi:MAG: hypothetical protein ABJI60_20440 [Kangiellaceae bacterium]|jgi:hypothetical protein